ncbi:MAG: hypothetical protein JNL70_01940 [Saprospiraceae bacterium]|nr:hypothetical protein [Saprospiraceae bacterium]
MWLTKMGHELCFKESEYITLRVAIDDYCEENPIDIVAALTQYHSFWYSLFQNSVMESLAWNSRLPLLVWRK